MSPRRQITYSQNPNHAARSAHAKGEKAFRTYDTSYIRPKRSPVPAIVGIVVLIAALAFILFNVAKYLEGCSGPVSTPTPNVASRAAEDGQPVEVTVDEGEGVRSIAKTLYDAGLIESQTDFTNRVNELGLDVSLQPGVYTIEPGASIDDIIAQMKAPVAAAVTFTVPEGSTVRQTAEIVAQATDGRITADDFVAAASNASAYAGSYAFLSEVGENSLEGFLFPKTYPIADDSTADSLIRAMLDQYAAETAGLDWSYVDNLGLSHYDGLKLASIVEKEAAAENRRTVASVFYNRLAWGWYLQSDATVAYEVGHDPTPEDIDTWTDYNTYFYYGLTPTPICSPGLDCLQAICAPDATDYFYFYFEPDENGQMQYSFSETFEEHEASYQ